MTGVFGLVRLAGVLVQLLAGLDRGQSLRHPGTPWLSDERSNQIVAAERPGIITPNE
jgi:hypothetical protein